MAHGLLMCAFGALGFGLVLTGGVGNVTLDGGLVLWRQLVTTAAEVGAAQPFRGLLNWSAWKSCVKWVQARFGERDVVLGRYEITGLALLAVALFALVLTIASGSLVLGLLALVSVFMAVPVVALRLAQKREKAIREAMPDLLRSLASSLGAGMTLSQAIGYVGGRTRGDVGKAFRKAGLEVACGMSVSEALQHLEKGLEAPGVGLLTCALIVSQRTGAPLEGLLNRSAELVEEQAELRASLASKTAQVRLSARLVMFLPIFIVAILALIMPDYRDGLATPLGIGCLVVAALLDACAFLMIRKAMVEVEP